MKYGKPLEVPKYQRYEGPTLVPQEACWSNYWGNVSSRYHQSAGRFVHRTVKKNNKNEKINITMVQL